MCAARSRPFFLSLGTVTGERVPVTINGEPVEFDAPGFKGAFLSNYCEIRVSQIRRVKQSFANREQVVVFLNARLQNHSKLVYIMFIGATWGNSRFRSPSFEEPSCDSCESSQATDCFDCFARQVSFT